MTREQAKDISNQKIFDILKTYTNMTDRDIRRHISQGSAFTKTPRTATRIINPSVLPDYAMRTTSRECGKRWKLSEISA